MHGIATASIYVRMNVLARGRRKLKTRKRLVLFFFAVLRLAMDLNSFFFASLLPPRQLFYLPDAKESSLFHSPFNLTVTIFLEGLTFLLTSWNADPIDEY